jgi:hypothetical protein
VGSGVAVAVKGTGAPLNARSRARPAAPFRREKKFAHPLENIFAFTSSFFARKILAQSARKCPALQ